MNWERFGKATGAVGAIAFVLVFFAASLDGRFDWRVFILAGGALFLSWCRGWMLVPEHLRHDDAEKEMWGRFHESDWRFVDLLSELSGSEIDEMRDVFNRGDDAGARKMILHHWPDMALGDVQEFIRFFNQEFMIEVSAFVDESGRLTPFD